MMYWQGMGWWGWLMMASFWILVIAMLIWVMRSTMTPRSDGDRAFRLLDERLARGEIDPHEYEERRQVLESRR